VSATSSPAPVDYLQQAREAYTNGKFSDALACLEAFRERYPLGSDEAWWLYGQTLEANSDSRDIRSSLDYYRRLLREYPQSPLCDDAHKRAAWLERYFFIQ
jgi:outer membrane protein assembly factor BamD (BamD/ComL family)